MSFPLHSGERYSLYYFPLQLWGFFISFSPHLKHWWRDRTVTLLPGSAVLLTMDTDASNHHLCSEVLDGALGLPEPGASICKMELIHLPLFSSGHWSQSRAQALVACVPTANWDWGCLSSSTSFPESCLWIWLCGLVHPCLPAALTSCNDPALYLVLRVSGCAGTRPTWGVSFSRVSCSLDRGSLAQ